jgi:hypothetical protein
MSTYKYGSEGALCNHTGKRGRGYSDNFARSLPEYTRKNGPHFSGAFDALDDHCPQGEVCQRVCLEFICSLRA